MWWYLKCGSIKKWLKLQFCFLKNIFFFEISELLVVETLSFFSYTRPSFYHKNAKQMTQEQQCLNLNSWQFLSGERNFMTSPIQRQKCSEDLTRPLPWRLFAKGFGWLGFFVFDSSVRGFPRRSLHLWLFCENQTHALLCFRRISNFQEKEMNQTKHFSTFVHIIQALLFYWRDFIGHCFRRTAVYTIPNEQFTCDFNTAFDFKKTGFFHTHKGLHDAGKFVTALIDERLVTMRLRNIDREPSENKNHLTMAPALKALCFKTEATVRLCPLF